MAFGALGHVASVGGGSNASLPAQNTVGAKLIVLAVTGTALSGTPTDNQGNVYLPGAPYASSPSTNTIAIFYCINPIVSSSHTFAYAGSLASMAASWWTASGPIKDQQNSSGTATPGTITPNGGGALVVTACSGGGGGGTGGTSFPGFTNLDTPTNNSAAFGIAHAYVVQSTPATVTGTWAGAGGLASAIVSFLDGAQFAATSTIAISTATAKLSGSTALAATPTIAIATVGDFTPPGLWATSSIRFAVTTALRSAPILRATSAVQFSTATPTTGFDYLVVGGGGGGGRGGTNVRGGGGGGGGGVRFGTWPTLVGSFPLSVGSSGVAATPAGAHAFNGGASLINSVSGVAYGGGGGGSSSGTASFGAANNGACGGASGDAPTVNSPGVGSQGGNGGANLASGGSGGSGGGGGGVLGNGANGVVQGTAQPVGGPGIVSTISGASVTYGKGGNGGTYNSGGPGNQPAHYTGEGGGAGSGGAGAETPGGDGSWGVVIISVPTALLDALPDYVHTGGTITVVGDRTIHTFTSDGTFYVGPPIATRGRNLIHLHRLPRRTRMLPAAALLLAAIGGSSCASRGGVTLHLAPTDLMCADRIPARLFLDPRCPNGVCGYTCAPNRWRNWLTRQLTGDPNHDETP